MEVCLVSLEPPIIARTRYKLSYMKMSLLCKPTFIGLLFISHFVIAPVSGYGVGCAIRCLVDSVGFRYP